MAAPVERAAVAGFALGRRALLTKMRALMMRRNNFLRRLTAGPVCGGMMALLAAAGIREEAQAAGKWSAERMEAAGDYVVLVHGLDWFRDTMEPTAAFLHRQGYETINVRYPSRRMGSSAEAAGWVRQVIAEQCRDKKRRIHLVAHSMGALVVRQYLAEGKPARLGRVVFLAAPNHGTPLAGRVVRSKTLSRVVGQAAARTCSPDGFCRTLPGKVDFSPGVIMGNRSGWFPYLSPLIEGPDDGVVSVESGRLEGMGDFRVLATSHTRMPGNVRTLDEVAEFLKNGRFSLLPPSPVTAAVAPHDSSSRPGIQKRATAAVERPVIPSNSGRNGRASLRKGSAVTAVPAGSGSGSAPMASSPRPERSLASAIAGWREKLTGTKKARG